MKKLFGDFLTGIFTGALMWPAFKAAAFQTDEPVSYKVWAVIATVISVVIVTYAVKNWVERVLNN